MATIDKPGKNLTLRIRRTFGGGARRMGTRVRVVAAVRAGWARGYAWWRRYCYAP